MRSWVKLQGLFHRERFARAMMTRIFDRQGIRACRVLREQPRIECRKIHGNDIPFANDTGFVHRIHALANECRILADGLCQRLNRRRINDFLFGLLSPAAAIFLTSSNSAIRALFEVLTFFNTRSR
ncbi:MAG: hypothetical protein U5J82_09775 [Desulfobacterales bacterium]|nr:hypothetical protein [Desulfobacterales bacterium]